MVVTGGSGLHSFSTGWRYDPDMAYRVDITARLQQRMLEIVGTALPLITRSQADADLVGLAHLRGEMVDAIDAYCRHIHGLRDDADAPAEWLDRLIAGCNELRATYQSFGVRWMRRDCIAHWHEYRLSAVVMMKQVRKLVQDAEAAKQDASADAA